MKSRTKEKRKTKALLVWTASSLFAIQISGKNSLTYTLNLKSTSNFEQNWDIYFEESPPDMKKNYIRN